MCGQLLRVHRVVPDEVVPDLGQVGEPQFAADALVDGHGVLLVWGPRGTTPASRGRAAGAGDCAGDEGVRVAARRARAVEPWYGAYLLLGVVGAGLLPIAVPVLVEGRSGLRAAGAVVAALVAGQWAAPLWGRLADRGRLHRGALVGGLLAGAGALAVLAAARPTGLAVAAALVAGVALAAPAAAASLLVVERHPPDGWDLRLRLLQSLYAVGGVAGLLGAGLLASTSGVALQVGAGALLAAAAVGLAAPRALGARASVGGRRRRARLPSPPGSPGEWARADPGRHVPHLRHARPRPRPSVRVAERRHLASWGLASAGAGGVFALYPLLLRDGFGIPVVTAAAVLAAAALVAVVGRPATARAVAGAGAGRALRWALVLRALVVLALAAAPGLGVPDPAVLALVAIAAVCWAVQCPAGAAVIAALEAGGGRGPGTADAVATLGSVVGALAAGVVAGLAGPVGVFSAAAASLGLAAVLAGGATVARRPPRVR